MLTIESLWLSDRALEHRIWRSEVWFLMVTWNFFSVPHLWQGEKYLSLYWEHVTYFYANHMDIEICSDYSVVEIDPINPCLRWEGVMSRQHQSRSCVLGLACCVSAFYCNHVLNICDLQCMHIFEHDIFFFRKRLLRQTESFWQVGNLFSSSFSINWFSDFIIHVNSFYIFRTGVSGSLTWNVKRR